MIENATHHAVAGTDGPLATGGGGAGFTSSPNTGVVEGATPLCAFVPAVTCRAEGCRADVRSREPANVFCPRHQASYIQMTLALFGGENVHGGVTNSTGNGDDVLASGGAVGMGVEADLRLAAGSRTAMLADLSISAKGTVTSTKVATAAMRGGVGRSTGLRAFLLLRDVTGAMTIMKCRVCGGAVQCDFSVDPYHNRRKKRLFPANVLTLPEEG